MDVRYHRRFRKQYRKLTKGQREHFATRLSLFIQNSRASVLNNHPLTGKYFGYRSIDITGDIRAIYAPISNNAARFIAIGTHSQLYG
ncbi:MAG: type II toxin-antitoxin system mRNA interferase toxin, RelE/StbE family [Candidatus Berkelbacteria bacterium]|nr:type II toxin-antitoxin system mRNA interferase toxin, RelE/StbE family [Candidatus Berkelbacteria bacterium]